MGPLRLHSQIVAIFPLSIFVHPVRGACPPKPLPDFLKKMGRGKGVELLICLIRAVACPAMSAG